MTRNVAFGLVLSVAVLHMAIVSVSAHEKDGPGKREHFLAEAQQICPVTGKDLSSMSGSVNATVGGQATFLCCKGCFEKDINGDYWAKIQSNLQKAQKVCPIRNVELGEEAVPIVVENRLVFVCCDSGACIKQVKADPAKYLAIVDSTLAKSLQCSIGEE